MNDSTSIISSAVAPMPKKSRKIPWTGGPSIKQSFSIPDSIIYYITMTPASPEVYLKLAKTCKYFFEKNPIIVVPKLKSCNDGVKSFICMNYHDICERNNEECCIKIDANKLSCRIWLIGSFGIGFTGPDDAPLLRSYIYRFDNHNFCLFHSVIKLDDFKFFVPSIKTIFLWKCAIASTDNKVVMLDKIFECIPNIEVFHLTCHNNFPVINFETMANILEHESLENLRHFEMLNIPFFLNLIDAFAFLTKHKNAFFWLDFSPYISEEYEDYLDVLIEAVVSVVLPLPGRLITYRGQDEEMLEIMRDHYLDAPVL